MILKIIETLAFSFFGVMSVSLLHISKKIHWRELVGYPIIISLIALVFNERMGELTREQIWGLVGVVGYITALLRDKGILSILIKGIRNTKDLSDSVLEQLENVIDKEEES